MPAKRMVRPSYEYGDLHHVVTWPLWKLAEDIISPCQLRQCELVSVWNNSRLEVTLRRLLQNGECEVSLPLSGPLQFGEPAGLPVSRIDLTIVLLNGLSDVLTPWCWCTVGPSAHPWFHNAQPGFQHLNSAVNKPFGPQKPSGRRPRRPLEDITQQFVNSANVSKSARRLQMLR